MKALMLTIILTSLTGCATNDDNWQLQDFRITGCYPEGELK
jgi:hypothetical protein